MSAIAFGRPAADDDEDTEGEDIGEEDTDDEQGEINHKLESGEIGPQEARRLERELHHKREREAREEHEREDRAMRFASLQQARYDLVARRFRVSKKMRAILRRLKGRKPTFWAPRELLADLLRRLGPERLRDLAAKAPEDLEEALRDEEYLTSGAVSSERLHQFAASAGAAVSDPHRADFRVPATQPGDSDLEDGEILDGIVLSAKDQPPEEDPQFEEHISVKEAKRVYKRGRVSYEDCAEPLEDADMEREARAEAEVGANENVEAEPEPEPDSGDEAPAPKRARGPEDNLGDVLREVREAIEAPGRDDFERIIFSWVLWYIRHNYNTGDLMRDHDSCGFMNTVGGVVKRVVEPRFKRVLSKAEAHTHAHAESWGNALNHTVTYGSIAKPEPLGDGRHRIELSDQSFVVDDDTAKWITSYYGAMLAVPHVHTQTEKAVRGLSGKRGTARFAAQALRAVKDPAFMAQFKEFIESLKDHLRTLQTVTPATAQ